MINLKEIFHILIAILIITIAFYLFRSIDAFPYTLLAVFFVFLINILAKKIASFYLDSEIEIKLWGIRRYGFRPSRYFKRPFPSGILFPVILSLISLGNFIWMACLVFDVKPKIYRAAKRHGLYSYSEMTEHHIGLIAAAGVIASLVFAVIGYLLGFSEFSRLSIFLAFFNMIPLSDLDGNKIFFGSLVLWAFLAALVLIGLGYVFFLV
jgi:Zn-dependent protease